jgi:hypothetical protein
VRTEQENGTRRRMGKMKIIITILITGIVVFLIFKYIKIQSPGIVLDTDGGFITLKEFPELVDSLKKSNKNESFFVVLIPKTAEDDGFDANFQFSIDKGELGIDWVLLAKRNIKDKELFNDVAKKSGLICMELQANGVEYIRAKGNGDLAAIGQQIIKNIYSIDEDVKMQLIITGMDWEKK